MMTSVEKIMRLVPDLTANAVCEGHQVCVQAKVATHLDCSNDGDMGDC